MTKESGFKTINGTHIVVGRDAETALLHAVNPALALNIEFALSTDDVKNLATALRETVPEAFLGTRATARLSVMGVIDERVRRTGMEREEFVMAFQTIMGLNADGVVGEKTIRALEDVQDWRLGILDYMAREADAESIAIAVEGRIRGALTEAVEEAMEKSPMGFKTFAYGESIPAGGVITCHRGHPVFVATDPIDTGEVNTWGGKLVRVDGKPTPLVGEPMHRWDRCARCNERIRFNGPRAEDVAASAWTGREDANEPPKVAGGPDTITNLEFEPTVAGMVDKTIDTRPAALWGVLSWRLWAAKMLAHKGRLEAEVRLLEKRLHDTIQEREVARKERDTIGTTLRAENDRQVDKIAEQAKTIANLTAERDDLRTRVSNLSSDKRQNQRLADVAQAEASSVRGERDEARKQRDDYKRRLDEIEREERGGAAHTLQITPEHSGWRFPRGRWNLKGFRYDSASGRMALDLEPSREG